MNVRIYTQWVEYEEKETKAHKWMKKIILEANGKGIAIQARKPYASKDSYAKSEDQTILEYLASDETYRNTIADREKHNNK